MKKGKMKTSLLPASIPSSGNNKALKLLQVELTFPCLPHLPLSTQCSKSAESTPSLSSIMNYVHTSCVSCPEGITSSGKFLPGHK